MADEQQTPSEKPVAIPDVAEAVVAKLLDPIIGAKVTKVGEQLITEAIKTILGVVLKGTAEIGATLAEGIVEAEDIAAPQMDRLLRLAFRDITGIDMGSGTPGQAGRGSRTNAARSLGGALFTAIAGTGGGGGAGGTLEPSQRGAEEYLTWVTQMALEGWIFGVLGEVATLGQVEALGALDDALAETLGLGRMSRRVIAPLLNAKVVTPFQWHVNKTYRPELLSVAECAKQIARHPEQREKWLEEMRRQGYREDQIEALLNGQRRSFSPGDVHWFVYRGHWTRETGLKHLADQGYTQDEAEDALRLYGLRRFDQHEDAIASAIVAAFVSRDIDEAELGGALSQSVSIPAERALYSELAHVRRELNIRRVTSNQVEQMVRSGVLSMIDYRRALEREGYPPDDVLALELQLRFELDAEHNLEKQRAQLAAERAEEKRRRDEERAAKKAAVEREREQHARGPLSTLEAAAIRGLIPLSRVEEVYRFDYDAETVSIMVELLEDRRQDFIDAELARADALQRAQRRNLSTAQLEAGVLANVVAIDAYRGALVGQGFDAGDVEILTSTLAARKAALDDAREKRRQAEAAAGRRSIDLGRFERLVRLGHRTIGQYQGLLADLGFDDGSIAAMRELVELQIADDTRARQEREAAEARLRVKGLSLEQFRRGVLLGVKTEADYQRFLIDQGFTSDAQLVLMAELAQDLADAEAARARRAAAEARGAVRPLPLSTVRRAAQLGVIAPETYAARLRAEGVPDDDVELDLELLLFEIADVQQRRGDRDQVNAEATRRGLTLAQVERGVKAGTQTLDAYRAAAAEAGYDAEAVAELVELLTVELAQLEDWRRREGVIAGELAARGLNLSQLKESVAKGFKTLDEFYGELAGMGYGADDAELLTMMLEIDLESKAATP